jgi:hypothetical protein
VYGFRYHLVTVISLFMALGIGLLLGGSLGQDVISKQQAQVFSKLEEKYAKVKEENARLEKQVEQADQRREAAESAMARIGSHYVEGRLQGKRILLVNLGNANVDPLLQILHAAAAEIQGTVSITDPAVFMPGGKSREWVQAFAADENGADAQKIARAAEALAEELCGRAEEHWLADMASRGFLQRSGTFSAPPDAVVVIGGATRETEERVRTFDLPLIQALCGKGMTVIGVERRDAPVSTMKKYGEQGISTVDSIDETAGGVALVDVINGAKGHYGTKQTAEMLLPEFSQK